MTTYESYEARLAAERAAEQNRAKDFVRLAKQIASELSKLEPVNGNDVNTWTFIASNTENSVRPYGKLTSDGLELDINQFRDNTKERISVRGHWPREKHGPYSLLRDFGIGDYNAEEPKITVSATGTAERIAKDIKRRLIDASELRVKYAKVLEVIAERKAFANRKAALTAELFAIVGQKPRERDVQEGREPEIRLYEYGGVDGDVKVRSDDRVRFELDVKGDVAREFLRYLVQRREKALKANEAKQKADAEQFAAEHFVVGVVGDR